MANKLDWPRNMACEILTHPIARQHGFHYAMIYDCADEKIEAALNEAMRQGEKIQHDASYFAPAREYFKHGNTLKQIAEKRGITIEGARQKVRAGWVAIVRWENLLPQFVLDCTGQSADTLRFLKEGN